MPETVTRTARWLTLVVVALGLAACSSGPAAPDGYVGVAGDGYEFVRPASMSETDGADDQLFVLGDEASVGSRSVEQFDLFAARLLVEGAASNAGASELSQEDVTVPGAAEATLVRGTGEGVQAVGVAAVAEGGERAVTLVVLSRDGALTDDQITTIVDSFALTD